MIDARIAPLAAKENVSAIKRGAQSICNVNGRPRAIWITKKTNNVGANFIKAMSASAIGRTNLGKAALSINLLPDVSERAPEVIEFVMR